MCATGHRLVIEDKGNPEAQAQTKWEKPMRIAIKVAATVATVVMSVTLLGAPAEAARDSGWGCPTCRGYIP